MRIRRSGEEAAVSPSATPTTLLLHDGELADVCQLLGGLGLEFHERRGSPSREDARRAFDLVVSTPKRLLELDAGPAQPVRIAILEKDSKTLRAMLHRAGVDLIVRRPVHPAALRLLVLHSLYRGPEKRRSLRVSVGAPVRFRVGLRRRSAILADLSTTGCRLLSPFELECGRRVRLHVTREIADGRPFRIRGTVVRAGESEQRGVFALALAFDAHSAKVRDRLRAAVAAHSTGPAVLSQPGPAMPAPATTAPPRARPEPTPPGAAAAAPTDRRNGPRLAYERHVIALGVEAARVLLGCDISAGGMRIQPHPDVAVGDELRIALHVRAGEKPLAVNARVIRDDAERGLVLAFHDLDAAAESFLGRMAQFLPILAVRDEAGTAAGVVVSEILDHHSEPQAARA
jgi:hypothetical protein